MMHGGEYLVQILDAIKDINKILPATPNGSGQISKRL